MFFSFFVLWCILGVVLQVVTLPLAAAIGLHRQLQFASVSAAAIAAYYVYLT